MRHLLTGWDRVQKYISGKKRLLLFLDYDGTLTPIVSLPARARLSGRTRRALEKLKRNRAVTLVVISGRSLEDIKRIVGVKGIIYAGNHGLQIRGPGIRYVNKKAAAGRGVLDNIFRMLKMYLESIPGALIEHKGLTLSAHYRRVKRKDLKKLDAIIKYTLKRAPGGDKLRLIRGKMVYEIRPPVKWDKGSAVSFLMSRSGMSKKEASLICIGDDRTDEDMFRVVKGRGIGVFVGESGSSSRASYYLRNTEEVNKFLTGLEKAV